MTKLSPERAASWASVRRKWLPDGVSKLLLGAPLAPSQEEWSDLLQALQQGDPLMDDLVQWMLGERPRENKELFERALTRGLASISEPPPALQAFFEHVEREPAWLDRSLLDAGAQVAELVGTAGYYVLRDLALMGGYLHFNSMNQVLASTGALQKNAAIRLAETGKWVAAATASGGLARFGAGFVHTIRVRLVHALVRRTLLRRADWDDAKWGLPINQVDLYATYLAFGPVTLMGARLFGVPVTPRDGRAALHMWRYIGWLSGVDERWLVSSEREGLRKLFHASLTHRRPDAKIQQLGRALRDEPLTRRLPKLERWPLLAWLVRRYLVQKHLANSALFLSPMQKRRLGLPFWSVPWYPILSAPWRFAWVCWHRMRGPRALARLAERQRAQQQRLLASYCADVD